MPAPELLLERLSAGYGDTPVVREVTLAVRAGEVVGLVGPNGSGKTTLVRVASRSLRPAAGRVEVAGHDPYRIPAREAARLVAVVPQDLAPPFSFTALELVLMGRTPYLSRWGGGKSGDWARVREAMSAASVLHLADRPVEELSGGERRRVVLAQALAQDAPVLLLDEPTTHLDIHHVVELLRIVRILAEREGKAVLAIHHDLNVAAASCDRLVALHRGEVVAEGPPQRVVTRELLRAVYGADADVALDETTGSPVVRLGRTQATRSPHGRRVHVIGGGGRAAPLLRRLTEAGHEVSVGVLHATDTDAAVAERLNLVRVSVAPFSDIDAKSAADCARLIAAADLLIVCDAPYGPGNLENLRLALDAARTGTRTLVLDQVSIAERDFTGGRATELWDVLRQRAAIVGSYEEVCVDVG